MIVLVLALLVLSFILFLTRRNRETGLILALTAALALHWLTVLTYIAKKGGITPDMQTLLYGAKSVRTAMQYLVVTLKQLGYAMAVGRYLFPLMSFAVGVLLAEFLHVHFRDRGKLHWRQEVVAVECAIMIAVGFMPQGLNMLANCLVSLACAMQVQSFRTVHGYGYASTMCIGNLRSGMAAVATYLSTRQKKYIVMARYYFGVILSFAVGAGIGGNLSPVLHERAIWTCAVLLLFSFWLMNWKGRKETK